MFGLGLTSAATGLSYALARWGFGNLYYLAQLLPAFMALYLLLAWLVYLRKTGLLAFDPKQKPSRAMGFTESEHAQDLPEDRVSGEELILIRDANGLVRRRPLVEERRETSKSVLENPTAALVWSAIQIAALSTYLYHAYGIGARFHL